MLVYIDDLLVHTDTHEKHLEVWDQVFAWLHKNHLKINLEKMRIRQQGSLIPGLHSHSRWDQTGEEQTQSHKRCQTDHRYQDHPIICRIVQLLQDTHQRLCPDSRTIIQANKEGFLLQIWATPRESLESFLHPAKATHFRTGDGLSKIRPTICSHHRCSLRNGRHFRGPGGHPDPSG